MEALRGWRARHLLWVLCLVCFGMLVGAVHLKIDNSDVQRLSRSCEELDRCNHPGKSGTNGSQEKNCACDKMCQDYGDCCVDAPIFSQNQSKSKLNDWKCFGLRQFGGVWMLDKCLERNENRHLVDLCENTNSEDFSDPLGSMPVTDASGTTYRNYYCGLCNGKEELQIWTPRLECPTLFIYNNSRKNLTHEYVAENLAYDGNGWGLYLESDNGSSFFHECFIDPVMPEQLVHVIRLCKAQLIRECAVDWTDEDVRKQCSAYTGLRYYHSDCYKNIFCALCNHRNLTLLTCHPVEYREMFVFRTFEHRSFSLLLDVNERKGQNVGMLQQCEDGEIFDPFFKRCRRFSCAQGTVKMGNKCIPTDSTSASSPPPLTTHDYDSTLSLKNGTTHDDNSSTSHNSSSGNTYLVKSENCLLISLVSDDYVMFDNKTIYVPEYDKMYDPTNYLVLDGSVLVCSHFEPVQKAKFSKLMGYVTVTGLGISMLCLFLHFLVFCVVPDLRNLSGKNLMSQCISLFFAYCFYIASQFQVSAEMCTALAIFTVYFFQASFFCMSVMAFDVWRTLRMATTELRVTAGNQWKRFIAYTFYSYVLPVLILAVACFAEYTDYFPEEYRPRFAQPLCWYNSRRALLCFFAVPLFVVTLSNIILFASSAKMIIMTTRTTVKQQNQSQRRNFRLYLRLFILMGLTWIVGLIAGYVDVEVMWYVFIVLNTLQGLFIFVSFSCTTKVLNHVRDRVVKFTKSEYRSSASHSTSHSGCNTNSTTALTSVSIKHQSTKLWPMKKHVASPTNSSSSSSRR